MQLRHRILLYGAALTALYFLVPSPWGPNQRSRYELARAMVLDGRFSIDARVKNTVDWSFHDGHYYSNKAPGSSFMAVPPLFVLAQLDRMLGRDPGSFDRRAKPVLDFFCSALPGAILALLLLLYLLSFPAVGARRAWLVSAFYAVGTIAFPYSLSFWGHQTAACFLFAAFYLLAARGSPGWSGFFFGLGVLTEYPVVLAAPAFLWLLRPRAPWSLRPLLAFCGGGLPVALLFGFYHQACFGAWHRLALSAGNPAMLEEGGAFGVLHLPQAGPLFNLLFGQQRGLFLFSPLLLLAPLGFLRWLRSGVRSGEALCCAWFCGALWLFTGSFNGWYGGCCAGPRYLLLGLPFLTAFLAFAPGRRLFPPLAALSVIHMAAISSGDVAVCVVWKNFLYVQLFPWILSTPGALQDFLLITLAALGVAGLAWRFAAKPEAS